LLTGTLAVLTAPVVGLRCNGCALKQHQGEDDDTAHRRFSQVAYSRIAKHVLAEKKSAGRPILHPARRRRADPPRLPFLNLSIAAEAALAEHAFGEEAFNGNVW
jgi:hypothetical protein